ncbi:hypothetical protein GCM10022254_00220 [Actinomadura meridiana]|uniref:Tyr recombinase domain-containing protein n=1 Tax=Actinomadura meridiana TaxID=559626 RepID=A0ABP8BR37_9ACTN
MTFDGVLGLGQDSGSRKAVHRHHLIRQVDHAVGRQEILGHSDIRLTQRYTHVASPMAQESMERMGRALWGSP